MALVLAVGLSPFGLVGQGYAASRDDEKTALSTDPLTYVSTAEYPGHAALEDGTYDVEVSLMKASDITAQSMASPILEQSASLQVTDGSYVLTVGLADTSIMGAYAGVTDVSYYPEGCTITNNAAVPHGNSQAAEVTETRTVDGVVYTAKAEMSLGEQAISDGYLYTSFYVAAMSSNMSAVIAIDWANFDASFEEPEVAADKTELQDQLAAVDDIGASSTVDYIKLQEVASAAQAVNEDADATQEDVDAQTALLKEALARYKGTLDVDVQEGLSYSAAVSFLRLSGQTVSEANIGNSFSETAYIQRLADTYMITLTTLSQSDSSITAITYGDALANAEATANDDGTHGYVLQADNLTSALKCVITITMQSGVFAGTVSNTTVYIWLDLGSITLVTDDSQTEPIDDTGDTGDSDDTGDTDEPNQDTAIAVSAPVCVSDLVYTGAAQIGVMAGTGYALQAAEGTSVNAQGNIVATNAGTYTVTASLLEGYAWANDVTGDTDTDDDAGTGETASPEASEGIFLNSDGSLSCTFSIAQAPLCVLVQNAEKTEGASDPQFVYSAEGLVGSEHYLADVICSREEGEDPGSYSVEVVVGSVKVLDAANDDADVTLNYIISTMPGVLTVIANESEPSTTVDTIAMLRLYNPYSGEHLYTSDTAERDGLVDLGWRDEGIGWYAPVASATPVYRLYNSYTGDHHYTVDAAERDECVEAGWTYEGIGWYSDDAQTVPLYRQFNPYETIGTHNYTADKDENDFLVSIGWREEGIGWYGC